MLSYKSCSKETSALMLALYKYNDDNNVALINQVLSHMLYDVMMLQCNSTRVLSIVIMDGLDVYIFIFHVCQCMCFERV